MSLNQVLTRIPLLLSYPAILLSASLISTYTDASDNDNCLHLALRVLLIPLAASAIVVLITQQVMKSFTKYSAVIFLISLTNALLTEFMGPVQASVLSVTFLQLFSASSVKFQYYIPLPALSLSLNYFESTSYIPTVISYAVLIVLLLWQKKVGMKITSYLNEVKVQKYFFSVLTITLLFGIGALVSFVPTVKINYSMVLVFIGCSIVTLFSFEDITQDILAINKKATIAHEVWKLPYTPSIIGTMSVMLRFLSSNVLSSSYKGALTLILFISMSGILPSIVDQGAPHTVVGYENVDRHCDDVSHHSHSHSHSHVNGKNDDGANSTASILRKLAVSKENRAIFSFLLLNFAFMLVQLLYSFRSKSLGLLSDSLHMALDCTSLLLGLLASVLSKNPSTDKFPFALTYLETLAGFTNGVLLLGIVSGILVEAVGRIVHPITLHGTNELIVVSVMGLLVNIVGLFACDHTGHDHDNENLKGIFLHILADTLGSVGVIVSTLLTKMFGSQVFDPLASIFIALMILLSSIPLLKSTTNGILLKMNDKNHALVKEALTQIASTPGIAGYSTPRFWPATASSGGCHSHSHVNTNMLDHGHEHTHADENEHKHEHELDHELEHSHNHNNSHSCTEKGTVSSSKTSAARKLIGYIHIQHTDGENSTIIKKRVEKIFDNLGITAWIQVEPNESKCWCRATSFQHQAAAH
ncbi:HEL176Cp [Eremothecium sinecaudum]|uniref:Zinc transporter n=1 Tax=Eremothecium sinecaudum TaxID=45286 RepID=A0A120K2C3_9SACH|nr:HEL176Cp [Eremothecium sinecaudum]AMD21105.1 HEL176Cp [Eremothecium sinecaudum]